VTVIVSLAEGVLLVNRNYIEKDYTDNNPPAKRPPSTALERKGGRPVGGAFGKRSYQDALKKVSPGVAVNTSVIESYGRPTRSCARLTASSFGAMLKQNALPS